jgi:hypothetical protein
MSIGLVELCQAVFYYVMVHAVCVWIILSDILVSICCRYTVQYNIKLEVGLNHFWHGG